MRQRFGFPQIFAFDCMKYLVDPSTYSCQNGVSDRNNLKMDS